MNKWLCYLINSLLCQRYKKDYQNFLKIEDISQQQKEHLIRLLAQNQYTEYGQQYGFETIKDVETYQKQVPLTTYKDYEDYVEKIGNGELNILTLDKVMLLEPTSGSTSASKLIPYNKGLKEDFQKGLRPWLYDLYTKNPGIRWGKSYWSITPAITGKKLSPGGIPIGFEEDSSYFGTLEKKLIDYIFAVPSQVSQAPDIDTFYLETSVHLLLSRNLTLISIWNPSFLFLLLEFMTREADLILKRIHQKNPGRAREVKECLKNSDYQSLWPDLKVISCWLDGHAAIHEKQLCKWFPKVIIQPKGLLATEGFISFPFLEEEGARLSLRSHFFEFLNTRDQNIYLAHELQPGQTYEVIITTSGGLYRYQMKDLVEVMGHIDGCPLLKFLGKADRISDLFGEKLHENHIEDTLHTLAKKHTLNYTFAMAAPEKDHYVLYLQPDQDAHQMHHPEESSQFYKLLAQEFDDLLRTNFHYDYCRRLGQLAPLRIFLLTGNPYQEYLDECVKMGQRQGDIKSTALHLKSGWDLVFKGDYL